MRGAALGDPLEVGLLETAGAAEHPRLEGGPVGYRPAPSVPALPRFAALALAQLGGLHIDDRGPGEAPLRSEPPPRQLAALRAGADRLGRQSQQLRDLIECEHVVRHAPRVLADVDPAHSELLAQELADELLLAPAGAPHEPVE